MKKIKFFALMSVIALTSAVGFTACSSSEDAADATADTNPTFDGTSVRTDFAFNITKASQGTTRMTAANVQEGTSWTFRGMQHMFLLPFTGEPTSGNATTLSTKSNIYALGGLATSEITPGTTHKKIYSLTFPIGTDNMLFYGTAANTTNLENYQVGKITSTLWPSGTDLGSNVTKKPSDITFSLAPIVDATNVFDKVSSGPTGDATKIINYLSHIAQAKYNNGTADVTWASTVGTSAIDGAYRALATLYNALTTKAGEARSGSTESVKRMVFDLYKSACAINHESSVADVQEIAKAICEAIESTTDGITFTVAYGNNAVTIANVIADEALATPLVNYVNHADEWVASISGIAANFPANVGLPMGAAQLRFDSSTSTFAFNTGDESSTPNPLNIGTDFTVKLSEIDYPSELIYFDNSPIRVTDDYKTAADFPSTPTTWDADDASGFVLTSWTKNGSVASTTRAVAMQNNVNYGVALLESSVKLASDATTMTDNKKNILGGTATNQTNIDPTKFNITGILIGGQPATVNWNMVDDGTSKTFKNVIYDRDVNNYGLDLTATIPVTLTTSESAKNYTVVFDNYSGDGTQDDVLIALEIVNGNQDFYGKHNLIPAGSTFYLVGKLAKSGGYFASNPSAGWAAKHPSGYRLSYEDVCRVFCQDYKSVANITLTKTSLQNAYSSIPDLVSTETVFGLSVDLTWEEGMSFNVNM